MHTCKKENIRILKADIKEVIFILVLNELTIHEAVLEKVGFQVRFK